MFKINLFKNVLSISQFPMHITLYAETNNEKGLMLKRINKFC